eukprot:TCALIF_11092-PA protein Name:"Similar to TBX18 T-box transcription factor TBX18 (Homo sapiens)" AED:0.06 eAED:0.06 QI:0/0.85/0.75/0.87/0.85/0.75/8/2523/452
MPEEERVLSTASHSVPKTPETKSISSQVVSLCQSTRTSQLNLQTLQTYAYNNHEIKFRSISVGPSSSDDVLSQTIPSLGTESWRRSPNHRPTSPLSISTQIPIDSSSTSSSNSNSPTSTSQSLANNSQRASPESSIQDSITPSPPQAVKYSPGFLVKNGIKVELEGQDLWKKFHRLSTEMIITKAGRRMFPTLKIRVSGLAATQSYMIFLDLVPFDDKRYRYVYHSSQWMVAGAGDPQPCPSTFVHGDSPASGNMWESQGVISFDKLKLTNNRSSIVQGQICLHSMHKYIPRIHVQPLSADQIKSGSTMEALLDIDQSVSFTFPETVFTTVTAYQNQQITKLKIASNPFAKGFREATRTRDPGFSDFNSFYNHQMNMEILRLNNPHLAHDQYSPFLYSSPHAHHLAPIPGSPLFSPLWNMLPPFMPMLRRSDSLTPSEASISPIHCHRMDDQ